MRHRWMEVLPGFVERGLNQKHRVRLQTITCTAPLPWTIMNTPLWKGYRVCFLFFIISLATALGGKEIKLADEPFSSG